MASLFGATASKLQELGSDEVGDDKIDVDDTTLETTIKNLKGLENAAVDEAIGMLLLLTCQCKEANEPPDSNPTSVFRA